MDHKVTLFPCVRSLLVLVVYWPVFVDSDIVPFLSRGRAVDKPGVQTVLYYLSQLLQARRDSLKVVVTEKRNNDVKTD